MVEVGDDEGEPRGCWGSRVGGGGVGGEVGGEAGPEAGSLGGGEDVEERGGKGRGRLGRGGLEDKVGGVEGFEFGGVNEGAVKIAAAVSRGLVEEEAGAVEANAGEGDQAVNQVALKEIEALGVTVGKFEARDGVVAEKGDEGEIQSASVVEFGAAHVDGEGIVAEADEDDLDREGAVGGEAGLGGVADEGDAAVAGAGLGEEEAAHARADLAGIGADGGAAGEGEIVVHDSLG